MEHPGHSLPEFQKFHQWLDQEKGFGQDPIRNALYFTTEVGEMAKEILRMAWRMESLGPDHPSVEEARVNLGYELADCLAYLLKLANYTGHDLQKVYTEKMMENINRTWR